MTSGRGRPTCHKIFRDESRFLRADALLTIAFEIVSVRNRLRRSPCRSCCAKSSRCGAARSSSRVRCPISKLRVAKPIARSCATSTKTKPLRFNNHGPPGCDELRTPTRRNWEAITKFGHALGLAFQNHRRQFSTSRRQARNWEERGQRCGRDKATYPAVIGFEKITRRSETTDAEQAHDAIVDFSERPRLCTLSPLPSRARVLMWHGISSPCLEHRLEPMPFYLSARLGSILVG